MLTVLDFLDHSLRVNGQVLSRRLEEIDMM